MRAEGVEGGRRVEERRYLWGEDIEMDHDEYIIRRADLVIELGQHLGSIFYPPSDTSFAFESASAACFNKSNDSNISHTSMIRCHPAFFTGPDDLYDRRTELNGKKLLILTILLNFARSKMASCIDLDFAATSSCRVTENRAYPDAFSNRTWVSDMVGSWP